MGEQAGTDLCFWSAAQVVEAIAARRLSAREYLAALLDRITLYNPPLNLVVSLDGRAEAAARRADDDTARGVSRGPLHGLAMTVKDSLCTAGLRTTAGSPHLARHVPDEDAHAIALLREAGAIVFGKTNLAAESMDVQSCNELFGVARNPWNPGRSPGGSSGGGAGAVAAGFTPVELGSDLAGSIRIPASNCGVFGHRPTFGVVPFGGHLPPYRPTLPDLAVVGPFARTVDDLETLLDVVVAPHPWDRPAWQVTLPPARPVRRVAVWADDPYCPVDPQVRAALDHAAGLLAADGVAVEEAAPAGVELSVSDLVMRRSLAAAAMPGLSAQYLEEIAHGHRRPVATLGGDHVAQRHRDWLLAQDLRARLRRCWHAFFHAYDAVLLPVTAAPAIEHDHRPFAERHITVGGAERPYWDQLVWVGLTGVCHLPTTVVPARLDDHGVPIGVAVTGPYLGDRTTLALARRLGDLVGSLGRPPDPTPTITPDGAR